MSSFRKLLMREAAFNAFNNKFNADLLKETIDKAISYWWSCCFRNDSQLANMARTFS